MCFWQNVLAKCSICRLRAQAEKSLEKDPCLSSVRGGGLPVAPTTAHCGSGPSVPRREPLRGPTAATHESTDGTFDCARLME